MASLFDDLDAAMSGAILTAHGEAAILRPRLASQYAARAVDNSRAEGQVIGVFSAGPAQMDLKGNVVGVEMTTGSTFNSTHAEFWISKDQLAELVWRPQKGDLVVLITRPGEPAYAVSRAQPTDMGDLNLILVREDQ